MISNKWTKVTLFLVKITIDKFKTSLDKFKMTIKLDELFNSHWANWSVDFRQFCEIALVGLKTHYIGVAATVLPQWCTSWSPKLQPLVGTPGAQPRGITYLSADGLTGVRTLRRGPVEAAAACSFFDGFCP